MGKLKTIDDETAQVLYDRLYYIVRCNLVDRKQPDNVINDQRARKIVGELIQRLDGLYISPPLHREPKHSDSHYREMPPDDVTGRAQRASYGRPHLLPVMNRKPVLAVTASNGLEAPDGNRTQEAAPDTV